ncbi:MAG: hypothetical protein H2060_01970 [Azoarcus sp.]|jgi:Sec-independent protein translocase protein TatA|nr:hypothetical protein [Azoarcus sp.]
MLWFFLILAIALMLLAATNRLEAIDSGVANFFRRLRLAWDYAREDVDDVEVEIREHARSQASAATADSGGTAEAAPPGSASPER